MWRVTTFSTKQKLKGRGRIQDLSFLKACALALCPFSAQSEVKIITMPTKQQTFLFASNERFLLYQTVNTIRLYAISEYVLFCELRANPKMS